MPGTVSDPMPSRHPVTEVRIADAKVLSAGFTRETLADLSRCRGATAIVAFRGTADRGVHEHNRESWATDVRRAKALDAWLEGFAAHVALTPEARAPFGEGVTVVLAVEADGTLRCVTHSDRAADCRRMRGWSDRWIFAALSRCPWETHLGVGNGGIPRGLTADERAQIAGMAPRYRAAWLDTATEAA